MAQPFLLIKILNSIYVSEITKDGRYILATSKAPLEKPDW